jgi:hypothetical protein
MFSLRWKKKWLAITKESRRRPDLYCACVVGYVSRADSRAVPATSVAAGPCTGVDISSSAGVTVNITFGTSCAVFSIDLPFPLTRILLGVRQFLTLYA